MRSVIVLLTGLLIGALGATMALRALSEGSEYPKGVMALMGKHFGALRKAAEAGTCDVAVTATHAATLRQVALDIEPAFLPGSGDDDLFRRHADDLRQDIAALEAVLGQGCTPLVDANAAIGQSCKQCHTDFRG